MLRDRITRGLSLALLACSDRLGLEPGEAAIDPRILELLDVALLPLHQLIDVRGELFDLDICGQLLVLSLLLALLLLHLLVRKCHGLALRLSDGLRAHLGGSHGTLLASGVVDRRAVIAAVNLFNVGGLLVEPLLSRLKPDLDLFELFLLELHLYGFPGVHALVFLILRLEFRFPGRKKLEEYVRLLEFFEQSLRA